MLVPEAATETGNGVFYHQACAAIALGLPVIPFAEGLDDISVSDWNSLPGNKYFEKWFPAKIVVILFLLGEFIVQVVLCLNNKALVKRQRNSMKQQSF